MNKYDRKYEIRLAKVNDIENIMKFIDTYWSKGHILARDRVLFEYEYRDGENVNFIIAIDRESRLLEGIFGFIKCSNTTDLNKLDIWGSMWKVNDKHDNIPLLGIEMARRVYELVGCRNHIGNGANPNTTIPLRKLFFKEKVGKMNQYYMLNPYIQDFKIASVEDGATEVKYDSSFRTKVIQISSIQEIHESFNFEDLNIIPYKDEWYFNKRYFKHPYYSYKVYGLLNESDNIVALMVTRSIECNGSKVLRVVDYIGEQKMFSGLGCFYNEMLKQHGYEYIDFYEYGFEGKYIESAGFKLRTDSEVNVIPNYFEPFLKNNVDIWVHYKEKETLFFKADGDQDRPNVCR